LNYVGVVLNIVSILIFFFVKLNDNIKFCADLSVNDDSIRKSRLDKFYERLSSRNKKILGIILSVLSGVGFGLCTAPTLYVQSNYANASQDFSDYLFGLASGAVFSNCFIVFLYCIYEKNMPTVNSEAVLPGFLTGLFPILNIFFLLKKSLNY
jgi:RsiW-degrading membrane proteinase PrsW (M82 family)